MARIIFGNKFISAYGIRRGVACYLILATPGTPGLQHSGSYCCSVLSIPRFHPWFLFPWGPRAWMMARHGIDGILGAASCGKYLPFGGMRHPACVGLLPLLLPASDEHRALYEKITFAILNTWDLRLSGCGICRKLCQFPTSLSLANGKFSFITLVLVLFSLLLLWLNCDYLLIKFVMTTHTTHKMQSHLLAPPACRFLWLFRNILPDSRCGYYFKTLARGLSCF